MKLSGYRLVGRQDSPHGFKRQLIELTLVLEKNDPSTLIGKYDLKEIPFEKHANAKGERYHKLYISPVINKFVGGDLDDFKQYVYLDFIHFGTDVYNENPKIIVNDKELQTKLFLNWKKLSKVDHYSECVIDDSASNCELLDFLKFKSCSIIR
tara:strand:- start:143 stop:601 length:459 start_codon:yes stop_codon:yes gene_type:complete